MWSVVILPSRTLSGVTWHRLAPAALIATGLSVALLLVVPASPIAVSEDGQPVRRIEAAARTTARPANPAVNRAGVEGPELIEPPPPRAEAQQTLL